MVDKDSIVILTSHNGPAARSNLIAMKKIPLIAAMHLIAFCSFAQPTVQQLRTENRTNPIGLDVRQPRFSWQLEAPDRNELQTAYEIRISAQRNGKQSLWNSGKVS